MEVDVEVDEAEAVVAMAEEVEEGNQGVEMAAMDMPSSSRSSRFSPEFYARD